MSNISDHIFKCPACRRECMLHCSDSLNLQRDFLDNGRIFRCPYHDCSARLTLAERTAVLPCTTKGKMVRVANIKGGEHSYAYVGLQWIYIINAAAERTESVGV